VDDALARFGAFALAPSELLVAAGLITVPTARWAAAGGGLLLLVFIFGIANALRQGRRPDCGCFGALRPMPIGASTLVRNGILLTLAVFLVAAAPGPAIDHWVGAHSAVEVIVTCAAVTAALTALVYLPQLLDRAGHTRALSGAPLPIGKRGPGFTLLDAEGSERSSQALFARGIPVVLVFGSPTCGPCVKLFPTVARWQRALAGRVRLVLIVSADVEAARAIAEQHEIAEVLSDPGGDVSRSYGISWSPGAFSLTPEGRIANGPASGADAIETLLRLTLDRAEPIPNPWIQTSNAA
jgi:thiol-disulfide isomerase/thioredoxin